MKTDIKIAQEAQVARIGGIARAGNIDEKYLEQYGKDKAKVNYQLLKDTEDEPDGKFVLVAAIIPTPTGEGRTATSVGLADGLKRLGKSVAVALRESSLGPVFDVKDGVAGDDYAQVVPTEKIDLYSTGDFHAVGAANNLLAALTDNHILQGNALRIDDKRTTWKRAVDVNDRQLHNIIDGLDKRTGGCVHEDGFEIAVASETMVILCLAEDLKDLGERLAHVTIGYSIDNGPVTTGDLHAEGALTALLRDTPKPNLVRTLEHTPTFIHGGPFANIAHGCNSVLAVGLILRLSDYAVAETGFGADLGAEKFIDIRYRVTGLHPDCAVMVATVRALEYHGGVDKAEFNTPDVEALKKGLPSLLQHVENITKVFGLPTVIAISHFPFDSEEELDCVMDECRRLDVNVVLSEVWAKGGEGSRALAREVIYLYEDKADNHFRFTYEDSDSLEGKPNKIVRGVCRGDGTVFTAGVKKQAKRLEGLDFGHCPVCMAKTQFSFSDDENPTGVPRGFKTMVHEVKVSAGTGFVVMKTGDIMTTSGLPKVPATEHTDVDKNGKITDLF